MDIFEETKRWPKACAYLNGEHHARLFQTYHQLGGGLIKLISEPDAWCGPATLREGLGQYMVDRSSDAQQGPLPGAP